jgi:hypothetical protein
MWGLVGLVVFIILVTHYDEVVTIITKAAGG